LGTGWKRVLDILFRVNTKIEVVEVSDDRVEKRKKKVKETIKRKHEELTKEEWLELMGVNRDTYKRHKGAIRRR
jgi:hypothetical protein